jgi:hypothetical protein
MMKSIWLSSLVSSEEVVKNLISQLRPYGLEVKGHFWEDNLEKKTWAKPRDELIKPDVTLWLILASQENLESPSLRYGLSLLSLTVQAQRGISFPIVILCTEGKVPSSETLPTPLKGVDFLSHSDPSMAAKLVVKINTPAKAIPSEYRIDTYGNAQIGQWIEVGPSTESWPGAMFGVAGGEIIFHAVGPKGSLPNQSVLNYPLRGLKLNLGEKEYTAWAAQNPITPETSYFVKIEGFPESFIFGPYSTQEEADVYVVKTK